MDAQQHQQQRHISRKNHPAAGTDQTVLQPASPTALSHAENSHAPWLSLVGLAIVATATGYGLYRLGKLMFRPTDENGFEIAERGVPHCKFVELPDGGFKVVYRKLPEWLHISFRQSHDNMNRGGHGGGLVGLSVFTGLLLALISNLTVGLVVWLWQLFFPMVIEVTRDAVIIKGRKLNRRDFRAFAVLNTRQIHKNEPSAVLGYGYGNQSFQISGTWRERHANEIASALNAHLRAVPRSSVAATAVGSGAGDRF